MLRFFLVQFAPAKMSYLVTHAESRKKNGLACELTVTDGADDCGDGDGHDDVQGGEGGGGGKANGSGSRRTSGERGGEWKKKKV